MKRQFVCDRCGKDLKNHDINDYYMVTDTVWKMIHPEGSRGFLCFACLMVRSHELLGRELNIDDFPVVGLAVNQLIHGMKLNKFFAGLVKDCKRLQ